MSEPSAWPPQTGARPRVPADYETLREVEAALATRAELGPEYHEHIAAGLAERVEQLAERRTAELRTQADNVAADRAAEGSIRNQRFALGIISLGTGVPITAIAATNVDPGLLGVVVAWAGIVGVNLAVNWRGRRR